MKRQIMKMKYITPAITIMETVMETNLLDGSTQGSGESVLPNGDVGSRHSMIPKKMLIWDPKVIIPGKHGMSFKPFTLLFNRLHLYL